MDPSLTRGPPCPSCLLSLVPCGSRVHRSFRPGPGPRPSDCGWAPCGLRVGAPCPLRCMRWDCTRSATVRWTPRCATGPVGPRAVGRVLQEQLLPHLAPAPGSLIFGFAETLARCPGPRIAAQGVYRDGVRSSRSHFVQAMGLRRLRLRPFPRRLGHAGPCPDRGRRQAGGLRADAGTAA